MNDIGLVQTVLNLTGFNFLDCLCNVHRYGTGLRVRHQALGTQHTTQTSYNAHHIGSCNNYVEIKPVLALNLGNQLLSAYIISAGSLSLFRTVTLSEYQHANRLTGSVRQHDSSANLLVCMTSVYAQTDMNFYSLIELCLGSLQNISDCFRRRIHGGLVKRLYRLLILFTSLHEIYLLVVVTGSFPPTVIFSFL